MKPMGARRPNGAAGHIARLFALISLITLPAVKAGEVAPISVRIDSAQIEITAQGITGDRVAIEVSTNLNAWSILGGIVLSSVARSEAQDLPYWPLPISREGLVTLLDSRSPSDAPRFYRLRLLNPGWEEARRQWTQLQIREYRYRFRRSCFCFGAPGEGIVHVHDGKVIEVDELSTPRVPPGPGVGDPALYPTIDGLFALLDRYSADGADVIQFSCDPNFGIPTWISVDQIIRAIDDEVSYSASEFQILSN